jgi:AraC-like DNA-binding protein
MSNSGHIDPNLAMLLFELDIFKLHNFIDDVMSPKFIKKSLSICGHDSNLKDYRNLINNFWHNDKISSITADIKISINKLSSPLPGSSVEIHRRYVEESDLTLVNLLKNIDIKLAIIKRLQNLEFGMPTMSEISSDLNMSERTLRRKLIKLNTSFSELRDHVRSNLAKELLIDSNHSTEDVAERLGYSDAANFRHAFKRWHGEPPSFFRKKMTSAKLWTAPQGNFRSGAILDSSDTSRSERR